MRKLLSGISLIGMLVIWSALRLPHPAPAFTLNESSPLNEVLQALGDGPLPHQVDLTIPGVSAEAGYNLVHLGRATKIDGGSTSKQSRHFVCTSCHNVEREDPDLSVSDPQARLEYVAANGMPFLQGTALYGAVNRTSFYNDDYEEKYGELVEPARNDIREAIQLCAVECSQGRPLKDWELESILAYLWEIQLQIGDLHLSDVEKQSVEKAINQKMGQQKAIDLLHSKYLSGSPATFVTPPNNRKTGYEDLQPGNLDNGKLIYELSCLHCHEQQRYAFFELNNSHNSFHFLKKHFKKYTPYSSYQVIRYGTSPRPGKRAYMPNYTMQKMSHQQVEDLRAYIESEAK